MLNKFVSVILNVIWNPYRFFSQDMPEEKSLKYPIFFALITTIVPPAIASQSPFSLLTPLSLVMNALLAHFLIFLFVPQRAGFRETLKVFLYASAANIFLVIPVIGNFLLAIFGIRAFIFGLSAAHKVSALKMFLLLVIVPIIAVVIILYLSTVYFGTTFLSFWEHI